MYTEYFLCTRGTYIPIGICIRIFNKIKKKYRNELKYRKKEISEFKTQACIKKGIENIMNLFGRVIFKRSNSYVFSYYHCISKKTNSSFSHVQQIKKKKTYSHTFAIKHTMQWSFLKWLCFEGALKPINFIPGESIDHGQNKTIKKSNELLHVGFWGSVI